MNALSDLILGLGRDDIDSPNLDGGACVHVPTFPYTPPQPTLYRTFVRTYGPSATPSDVAVMLYGR